MISLRSRGPAQMPQNVPKQLTSLSRRDAVLMRRAQNSSAAPSEPIGIFDESSASVAAEAAPAAANAESTNTISSSKVDAAVTASNGATKRRASALTERSATDINANITSLFDSIAAKKPSKYAAAANRERIAHGTAHTSSSTVTTATVLATNTTATTTGSSVALSASTAAMHRSLASSTPPLPPNHKSNSTTTSASSSTSSGASSSRLGTRAGIASATKATPPPATSATAPRLTRSESIEEGLPRASSSALFRTPPLLVTGHTATIVDLTATPKPVGPEMVSPLTALDIGRAGSSDYIIDYDSMPAPSLQRKDCEKYDPTYASAIDKAMREREEPYLQPRCMFTAVQVEVTLKDHAELVEWISEVCIDQQLQQDTLYLSVHIMDTILSSKAMKKASFQLLGATALLIATKVEEVQALAPDLIVSLAGFMFTTGDLIRMETFILNCLNYNINIPSRLQFLERFIHVGRLTDREAAFARYLTELSLYDYNMYRYRLSKVAAAAVNLALQTLRTFDQGVLWDKTLSHYSKYEDGELVDAVVALQHLHARSDAHPYLSSLIKKYEAPEKFVVSRIICPLFKDFRYSPSARRITSSSNSSSNSNSSGSAYVGATAVSSLVFGEGFNQYSRR